VIFIDRDGTLIIDKNYLSDPKGIEWFPDTSLALQLWQSKGVKIFILTNQSGVGRGYFTMKEVHAVHDQMQTELKQSGLKPFDGFLICPHRPDENCQCRKPKPTLLLEKLKELKLKPEDAWMIGDKEIDVEVGVHAGCESFLVRSASTDKIKAYKDLLTLAKDHS
jgi:D-glycero-D-manno-heptose 1,7-bisphosphate phosphatase